MHVVVIVHLIGLESLSEAFQFLVGPCQQLLLLAHPQPHCLQMLHPPHTLILNAESHVKRLPCSEISRSLLE
jgi:hypothetical protein